MACTDVYIIKKTIMPCIIINNCAFLLFWPLIFCTFISADKDILNCMIKDGETEIHLNLIKTKQLLANEHLPVWIAKAGEQTLFEDNRGTVQHELQKNFMRKNIGNFILYHDIKKSSAIVYYENTKTLHGMIDTRYVISKMPVNECNRGHHVGGQYVNRLEINVNVHDHLKPLDLSVRHDESTSHSRESSDQYEIPTKRQRLDETSDQIPATIFYPEILIFVPYELIKHIQHTHALNVLATIVRHFIIFFNGMDMLLAKLSTDYIKIHLNLAGIVFEDRSDVFGFTETIYVSSDGDPSKKLRYLNVHRVLKLIPAYIKANRDIFSHDSFDFYFMPSTTDIWSTMMNHDVEGISKMFEIYTERLRCFSDACSSGFVVYQNNPLGYVTAAHELAHLLDIDHDSEVKGYCDGNEQCYAIMQKTGTFCPDCLKWTNQNIENLQKFTREHRNRCFLLNEPRSLHPHGYPMRTLSRLEQCHCYGYKHWPIKNLRDTIDEVPYTDCNQNLICGKGSRKVHTILPLDGTPCANNKVCWNKVCQNIIYRSEDVLQGSSNQNKYN